MLFRNTVLAAAASFATLAQADYTIDPSTVPESTRENWCDTAKESCPFLCQQTDPGTTLVNTCDPDTLQYGCLCGDNKQPNVSEYSMTIPYFVCQEWGNQCVKKCGNNNKCASACREDHPCGALDPSPPNKTATATASASASASATDDGSTVYTDGPGNSSDKKGGAAAALSVGRKYGLGVVLGSLFVGFALL